MCLARVTNTVDVGKGPTLDDDDDETGYCGGGNLSGEHDSGWDLHIVTEFQVAGEVTGLFGHDSAINFEDHDSNRPSGNHVASNELGKDVESQLLVGDRLQDAEGEDEDQGEGDSENVGPEGHLRVVNLDCNGSKDEGNDENNDEPPVRNVWVASHEAGMNVLLVLDRGAEPLHDITSVP